ncbi:MAG TPA: glutamine--fructose-6-phosphate transaminase (isomerizing) [Anaerolineae bacterium]|nr:glutamine--fructose-6-phosphate transaminase (isomerizing) [Anaerolineae bacterium]
MCGIVGYIGPQDASSIVLQGLRRLEYRGYDSAGLAVIQDSQLVSRRSVGRIQNLADLLVQQPVHGHIGIGHTRWATHGSVTEANTHPHTDCKGEIVVIHNGIVENYRELKQELLDEGHIFRSQTDTEVIAHLVEKHRAETGDLSTATRLAMARLKGASAVVVLSALDPHQIVTSRLGNAGGIVVGHGRNEMFVASDMSAILEHTQQVSFVESRELATVTAHGALFFTLAGDPLEKETHTIPWDPVSIARGRYKHFMLKEIEEQGRSVTDVIRGRLDVEAGTVHLEGLHAFSRKQLRSIKRVYSVACGTAWHAAILSKFIIEKLARVPVEVDYGSEFRYRDPLLNPEEDILLVISQSGETVDTLAAMEEARNKGLHSIGIVNVVGSQAARLADGVVYLNAGPEIGVASTKAFTSMLVATYLLGLYLGQERGVLDKPQMERRLQDVIELPALVGKVLASGTDYEALAQRYFKRRGFLYLGRGLNYPIALEGALKLKEISYIHAEGYPAGEMKHGPIALIDENMPVVAIAVRDSVRDKMLSNIEQVRARGGTVIAIATEGDEEVAANADTTIFVPAASPLLTPVLTTIPLQLLAYHIAVRLGCDVDQPRNLAKSVTVE